MRFVEKRYYSAKNWALSAASLGGSIPIGNYDHYFNQTHCPSHGILHTRGTVCPLCLQDKVHSGELSKQNAQILNERLKELNKEIEKIYTNLSFSQSEREAQIDETIAQKRQVAKDMNMLFNLDKRDTSYKHSREYLQSQLKQIAEYDKKYGYKIKTE